MRLLATLLCAVMLMFSSASASVRHHYHPVVHTISKDDMTMLSIVNHHVNNLMTYTSDQELYGIDDMWVMAPTSWKGDCEDYALTKLFILEHTNTFVIPRLQIRLVLDETHGGHAVLVVDNWWVLDNRYKNIMTKGQLSKLGYRGL